NDIQYLLDHNMLPVGPGYQESKEWKVGPGMKSTLLADFQSMLNEPAIIPLMRPYVSTSNTGPASTANTDMANTTQGAKQYPSGVGNEKASYIGAKYEGQNGYYEIIGFAGIALTQATGDGTNMNISLQACGTIDATTVLSNINP